MNEELHLAMTGGVWKTTSVTETPELNLSQWCVYEIDDNKDRHFVGYNETEGEGRVSSKIVQFDKESMRGITASGRVYQLVGNPGRNGDAAYVWARWKQINDVMPGSYKNVSDELTRPD
jgi:hypothetical protein